MLHGTILQVKIALAFEALLVLCAIRSTCNQPCRSGFAETKSMQIAPDWVWQRIIYATAMLLMILKASLGSRDCPGEGEGREEHLLPWILVHVITF